ncbi:MAG: S8/S53 family peptidase [Gammaproteobacteria bacterium]|nr:S8/S53 family peptidase [Gammaproteobacteria bacterium]MDH4316302.1 S8/S53 family peptidase [Gammaproteobacteria bacterium]MDH5215649.1 S8/S53 family peptidase [Gammaproteobacteria bacterium]
MTRRMCVAGIAVLIAACGADESAVDAPTVTEGDPVLESRDEAAATTDVPVRSWLIETAEDLPLSAVREFTTAVISGELLIEPLFPGSPDLAGMYLIEAESAYGEREAFDIAYRLKDLPQVVDAVPNFATHEPDLPREASAACLFSDSEGVPQQHDWSLKKMHVREAWELEPMSGGKRFGEGVTVCHPDSGWAEHLEYEADAINKSLATDLIDEGGTGEDPLDYSGNPGHGTATGSVIASRGDDDTTEPPGGVFGIAPRAKVIPIRALKSVVHFLDSDVARAVDYARAQSCDVVSMSLGGAGFFGLKKAIRKAVEDNDKIVVAAAGNCVGRVVAPAKYGTTIAAAASNWNDVPWKGSSKGRAVTVTAPGEGIWVARRERGSTDTHKVDNSNGTSYATAAIAGAAADWIAFHGKERLNAAKGQHSLTALFRFVLQDAVNTPDGWDTGRYGPGILDVEKLLQADIDAFPKDQPRSAADADTPLSTLSRTIDRSPRQTRDLLQFLFGTGDPDVLAGTYGAELERMAATRPADMQRILDLVDQRAVRSEINEEIAGRFSTRLQKAVGQ